MANKIVVITSERAFSTPPPPPHKKNIELKLVIALVLEINESTAITITYKIWQALSRIKLRNGNTWIQSV